MYLVIVLKFSEFVQLSLGYPRPQPVEQRCGSCFMLFYVVISLSPCTLEELPAINWRDISTVRRMGFYGFLHFMKPRNPETLKLADWPSGCLCFHSLRTCVLHYSRPSLVSVGFVGFGPQYFVGFSENGFRIFGVGH